MWTQSKSKVSAVFVLYMHIHDCACACTWKPKINDRYVFLGLSHLTFWYRVLMNLELFGQARVAGQQGPHILLSLPFSTRTIGMDHIDYKYISLDSGSPACVQALNWWRHLFSYFAYFSLHFCFAVIFTLKIWSPFAGIYHIHTNVLSICISLLLGD